MIKPIVSVSRCDFDRDCTDGSDESDCGDLYRNCSVSETACENGHCVHESRICDGRSDCDDDSDELHCNDDCQEEDQFRCSSPPKCIYERWR